MVKQLLSIVEGRCSERFPKDFRSRVYSRNNFTDAYNEIGHYCHSNNIEVPGKIDNRSGFGPALRYAILYAARLILTSLYPFHVSSLVFHTSNRIMSIETPLSTDLRPRVTTTNPSNPFRLNPHASTHHQLISFLAASQTGQYTQVLPCQSQTKDSDIIRKTNKI
jgi:hypothetical protein